MEVVEVWVNNYMIQKINKPGVILEVTRSIESYVPKDTVINSHYKSKVKVTKTETLPIIFSGNLLAKYFVEHIARHVTGEYEIVPATHEWYTKSNSAFRVSTKDDLTDISGASWSNINN